MVDFSDPLTNPFARLDEGDLLIVSRILGSARKPDLIIAPEDGRTPYLYRWHVVRRNPAGNCYLHLQVASDPERPLHDHPWDNQSVILSGGYDELVQLDPPYGGVERYRRFRGQTIHRLAETAHRLILPTGVPYTLSLFTTGPVRRDWGFWLPTHRGFPRWASHDECIVKTPDRRSTFKLPEAER